MYVKSTPDKHDKNQNVNYFEASTHHITKKKNNCEISVKIVINIGVHQQ